jgi:hypothetical protein
MPMKTSELTGAALDWAVAKCEGVLLRTLWSEVHDERHWSIPRQPTGHKVDRSLSVRGFHYFGMKPRPL